MEMCDIDWKLDVFDTGQVLSKTHGYQTNEDLIIYIIDNKQYLYLIEELLDDY